MRERPDGLNERGQTVANRERAAQVLRDRARRMHEEAVQLEQLADWAIGLNDAQDAALWRLAIQGH